MGFFSRLLGRDHEEEHSQHDSLVRPPSESMSESMTSNFLSFKNSFDTGHPNHPYAPVSTTSTPLVVNPMHDEKLFGEYATLTPHIHHSHMTKAQLGVKEASIPALYFTLANTIMGAGTLGLPFALSNTGYVLGSVLLCVSAISSSFALHLLALCALKLPYPSSFYKVAATAMPNFEKLIDLAVILKCFGVATSYLIVIGGLMPDVMEDIYGSSSGSGKGFFESRLTWISVALAIVAPLSFFKQLEALKYTSAFSLLFIFFLAFMVVLFASSVGLDPCDFPDSTDECVGERANVKFDMNTMRVFSIFIFGFTCHQNMFTVVNELRAVSVERCNSVVLYAVGTAVTTYLVIANFGYFTYGSNVESNILVSYPKASIVSVARCFVSLLVCFTYPLQCNPARKCVMTLMASIFKDDEKPEGSLDHILFIRHITITAVFVGLSYVIALSVKDLGVMLSLVGATGSTLVSYILPGFCYYYLFRNEGPAWKRNLAFVQGWVGVLLIPICLTFIFL